MGGTSSVEKIVRRGRLKTGRERDWRDRLSEREKKREGEKEEEENKQTKKVRKNRRRNKRGYMQ